MTIKKQFILLIVLVTLSMLALLGLGRYNAATVVELEQEALQLGQIEVGMLTLRRNEKDFLARKDPKYLDQFTANHQTLMARVHDLQGRLEASGIDAGKALQTGRVLEDYAARFRDLVAVQQEIGLDEKSGLYGSLRTAVHGVEKLVKEQQDHHLLSDMLMLRRNEKDFMLRDNLKYVDKLTKNVGVFNATLAESDIPAEVKEQIATAIAKYQADFMALVDGYQRKGLSAKEGILGDMRNTVHQTEQLIEQMGKDITGAVDEHVLSAERITLAAGLALLLLIVGILVFLSRNILRPVQTFALTMSRAADERDVSLRADVTGKCEISDMARAFNGMMDEFQALLRQVTDSAASVAAASTELATVTENTANGVERQRVESDQVATAMNEMASTVQEVARHAEQAAEASNNADGEASEGARVVAQSVTGIKRLAEEVERTAATISELEKESDNIGTVLSVITGIAEQTNLLALNAAIEAARAGEQGRGFAVVADEVRTLAQRSQQSTEEIKTIIDRLQGKAQAAVQAMQGGREQAQVSVEQAEKAGGSLSAIAAAITAIRDMNTQIASAAEEQSAVAEEINQSVVRITQVAEESAQGAEETTRTSGELAELAAQMQARVSSFRIS